MRSRASSPLQRHDAFALGCSSRGFPRYPFQRTKHVRFRLKGTPARAVVGASLLAKRGSKVYAGFANKLAPTGMVFRGGGKDSAKVPGVAVNAR